MDPPIVKWPSSLCAKCGDSLEEGFRVHPALPSITNLLNVVNRVPSASEAAAARIALDQTNSEIDRSDEEIAAVERIMDRLWNKREGLQRNREVLQTRSRHLAAVMAPIKRLPIELLTQIFGMCMPYFEQNPRHVRISLAREVPLLVSHVGRHWRELVLSTPSLWTQISFSLRSTRTASQRVHNDIARMQHWLNYSGGVPLSVAITRHRDACSLDLGKQPVVDLLLLHSTRWRTLNLHIEIGDLQHYFHCLKGRLAALRTLRLSLVPWQLSPLMPVDYFEDAPELVKVVLDFRFPNTNDFKLPWHALTHLDIGGPLLHVLEALRHCPSLASCWIILQSDASQGATRIPTPVILPQLRRLSVVVGSTACRSFFDNLTTPELQILHLTLGKGTPCHHITPFLSRSSHTLDELSLHGGDIHGDIPTLSIVEFLEAVPRLKRVSIQLSGSRDSSTRDTDMMRRLTLDPWSSPKALLPNIESLQFEVHCPSWLLPFRNFGGIFNNTFNDAFADMLLSRRSSKVDKQSLPVPALESRLRGVLILIDIFDTHHTWKDPFQEKDLGKFLRVCQRAGLVVSPSWKPEKCLIHIS